MEKTRLVLLPGMDGTGILFEPLLELLPPELEVKVVSYPVNEPCGYEGLVERIRAALPEDGPYFLVGESFSGPLAIMVAEGRPAGLQGIVLCASFVRSPAGWLARFMDALVTRWTLAMVPAFFKSRMLLGAGAGPRLRMLLSRAESLVSPEVMVARIKAVMRVDVSEELRRCPVPVLYLRAERDHLVPTHCSEMIAECNPDSRIVSVVGPHLVLQTNPADVIAAICEFIERRNHE